MSRTFKMISLLLAVLLLVPMCAMASEDASSETALQPAAEMIPSEVASSTAEDEENSGDSSTSESSGQDSSTDSSSSGSTDTSTSAEDDAAGSDTSDEDSSDATTDDELTGEAEGNTAHDSGEEGGNSDGNTSEKEEAASDAGDSPTEETENKEESNGGSSTKKSSGVSYAKARTSAIYEGAEVSVEELGTIHSRIKLSNGELCDVLTAELTFPDLEGQALKLAYLVAPKTGRASLRDKPAKSETIIRYGNAGDLVIVLEEGEDYTYILYRGTKCYAVSTTLQLIEIPEEDGEYAQLSYEERTDGGTTINVRNQPDRNSCKIAEWRTGTEVTVWSYTDGWYEIEANGMRGFVMEQFISIAPGV